MLKSQTGQKILKSLQQGEDLEFDQIMNVLGCVAEHCLSSLFDALFTWLVLVFRIGHNYRVAIYHGILE